MEPVKVQFSLTTSGTKPVKRQFGDLAQISGATCTAPCAGRLHATGKAHERHVEELCWASHPCVTRSTVIQPWVYCLTWECQHFSMALRFLICKMS